MPCILQLAKSLDKHAGVRTSIRPIVTALRSALRQRFKGVFTLISSSPMDSTVNLNSKVWYNKLVCRFLLRHFQISCFSTQVPHNNHPRLLSNILMMNLLIMITHEKSILVNGNNNVWGFLTFNSKIVQSNKSSHSDSLVTDIFWF